MLQKDIGELLAGKGTSLLCCLTAAICFCKKISKNALMVRKAVEG